MGLSDKDITVCINVYQSADHRLDWNGNGFQAVISVFQHFKLLRTINRQNPKSSIRNDNIQPLKGVSPLAYFGQIQKKRKMPCNLQKTLGNLESPVCIPECVSEVQQSAAMGC